MALHSFLAVLDGQVCNENDGSRNWNTNKRCSNFHVFDTLSVYRLVDSPCRVKITADRYNMKAVPRTFFLNISTTHKTVHSKTYEKATVITHITMFSDSSAN